MNRVNKRTFPFPEDAFEISELVLSIRSDISAMLTLNNLNSVQITASIEINIRR